MPPTLARVPMFWGEEKAQAVRDFAHRHGLSLPKSHAYTDHFSDLHFLQLVGNPVVVNGTPRLRWVAWRKNWPRVRWKARQATGPPEPTNPPPTGAGK